MFNIRTALRKCRFGLVPFLFSVVYILSSPSLAAVAMGEVDTVDKLLKKLSHAIRQENYRGLFTYEHGGTLDTMEIVHAVQNGAELERLQHLNGPPREFIRRGRPVDCATVSGHLLRGALLSIGNMAISLDQNYHFYLRGDDRIAGRNAHVLQVVPKDGYRYGLTIAIDKISGLPLKSLVMTNTQKVLERFQFIELEIGKTIDPQALRPSLDKYYEVNHDKRENCEPRSIMQAQWRAVWVPHGFVPTHYSYAKREGHMLNYTDGLASFSVFVKPLIPGDVVKQGVAQRGATVALMSGLSLENRPVEVTVVGEIPAVAARRVAASMRPIQ